MAERMTEVERALNRDAAAELGKTHMRRGEWPKALGYLEHAIELGAGWDIKALFVQCLARLQFTAAAPTLKPLLVRAMRETWAPPADLSRICAPILMLEPHMREALASFDGSERSAPLAAAAVRLAMDDALLWAMLDCAIVADPAVERLLTGLRHALLTTRDGGEVVRRFAAKLACQCFANEYAYVESDRECGAVETLCHTLADALHKGEEVDESTLAIAACYRPLSMLGCDDLLLGRAWPSELNAVVTCQLRAPAAERVIADGIERLTPIREGVSKAVEAQYSENPFPRWIAPPQRATKGDLQAWLGRTVPAALLLPTRHPREILVTGCGTGQETVGLSLMFADVDILAVDLSRTSLAYAARKTGELGLTNVRYAQGDLLNLGNIGRQFDLVVSAGVLHHLADPAEGLAILTKLARPGGCLMLALYSELGRRALKEARDFATEGGYGTSAMELRRYRKDVLALPAAPWRSALLAREDFYSLSMLRDLVFHVQEHRFTMTGLKELVGAQGLCFLGFAAQGGLYQAFARRFGRTADPANLDLWTSFEQENPDAFGQMYHFLAQKPA
jgi:SAM-dependent methyltransferase